MDSNPSRTRICEASSKMTISKGIPYLSKIAEYKRLASEVGLIIQHVLAAMPSKEKLPTTIVKKVISLEEMIGQLSERISSALKMSFRDFSKARSSGGDSREQKVNVIVSFLAMLELIKRGVLAVRQESDFGDIEMETQTVSTPRY